MARGGGEATLACHGGGALQEEEAESRQRSAGGEGDVQLASPAPRRRKSSRLASQAVERSPSSSLPLSKMEPVDREGSSGSEASDVRRSPRIVVPQDSTMLGRNEEFFDDRLEYEECITRPFFPAEAFALATVPRPLNTPTTQACRLPEC